MVRDLAQYERTGPQSEILLLQILVMPQNMPIKQAVITKDPDILAVSETSAALAARTVVRVL